jgi:O-antigen/teichoic acid export membrane protein
VIKQLLKNVISSWTGYAVTLLVGFCLAPFLVNRLGATGYGVWTLVVAVTAYCGLLDLGLRSAVIRFVVRYVAQGEQDKVNRILSSALVMLAGAGILALCVTGVIYLNFDIFRVGLEFESAASVALLITGLNVAILLPLSVFGAVLPSLERYDVVNGIAIVGALLRAILVVTVVRLGYGIVALSVVSLLVSTAEQVVTLASAKLLYKPLSISWRFVDMSSCVEVFSFGLYRFIWIISNQVIFYTDSVVIGVFLGAGVITSYAIAASLITYGRTLVSLAIDTFFPAVTRLSTTNALTELQDIYILGTRFGAFIGMLLGIGYITFGDKFIRLWMGNEHVDSAHILSVLTIAQLTSMSQYMSALIVLGTNRHKVLSFVALSEAVANLGVSIWLVSRFGVIGVAWGTVIPHVISAGVIVPCCALRVLRMRLRDYVSRALVRPIACAIPVALTSYALSQSIQDVSWLGLGGMIVFETVMFTMLIYKGALTNTERMLVRRALQRLTVSHDRARDGLGPSGDAEEGAAAK